MKKYYFVLLLMLLGYSMTFANEYVQKDFVRYEVINESSAKASLTLRSIDKVIILDRIKIKGKEYVVTEIGEARFSRNSFVMSVVIPSTVNNIRARAFAGCINLKEIVLPTGPYFIDSDAFIDCKNITTISGNTIPYISLYGIPNSVDNQALKDYIPKFYNYAKDDLMKQMEKWQAKKDYETVEQYKTRVTEDNRILRMKEFEKAMKDRYVEIYAPKFISTYLDQDSYDNEYEVYTIQTDLFGKIFAKVPKADALKFRQNYKDVLVKPHFGVQGDTLAILSCEFEYNGKIYTNAKNYNDNDKLDRQFELPPLDIEQIIAEEEKKTIIHKKKTLDRTIDKDIPLTGSDNNKTFVLIIGNEKYKRIAEVPFANNDANVFADYCQKTLGIPQKNIDIYKNASINDMRHGIQVLVNRLKAFNGEARALVYYSGHGYPDEATKMPYLMPIDGFASDISNTGYNLNEIYDELAEAPSQLTLLLLDACFSGTTRNGDMAVNAKGVARAARSIVPTGNMMVFSASQGIETAYVDEEHGHGRFTYYLLKHLHDTKGDTTLGGLVQFVTDQVRQASVIDNGGKTQTPTPNPSFSLGDSWKSMRLR